MPRRHDRSSRCRERAGALGHGAVEVGLADAGTGVIPVCGALDATTGLVTLTKCDGRLEKLEAEVAALMARLGVDAGTD
jgi:hypothetical protein